MITRSPRPTSNFYLLDKAISEDKRLSWAARGLLIFLLGKPDHWTVSPAALTNETKGLKRGTGRDGVYAILNELKEVGYLQATGSRDASGSFAGTDYLVTETPNVVFHPHTPEPDTAGPDTAEPRPANPPQVSIDSKQGLRGKQGLTISDAPTAQPTAKASTVTPEKQKKPRAKTEPDAGTEALKSACREAWAAYSGAYRARYGTAPLPNLQNNAKMKQFVQRVPYDEAPGIAVFFVNTNDAFAVRNTHGIGLLLASAESYRTQWATNQSMTATRATQIDKTQTNFNAAGEAMAILRAKREMSHAG